MLQINSDSDIQKDRQVTYYSETAETAKFCTVSRLMSASFYKVKHWRLCSKNFDLLFWIWSALMQLIPIFTV